VALLSQRNFDPDTRTLRRADAKAIEDTVEKNVDGLVEEILAADKQRQEAELVSISSLTFVVIFT
jgi:coiled-coil domain-containing protein 12